MTILDSTLTANQAVGGADGTPTAAEPLTGAARGGEEGAGGSEGHGVGGGAYNLGAFAFDIGSVVKKNEASTSNDDIFP